MATDVQSLMTQGNCYACYGNLSGYEIMKISLLAQIAVNLNASADVTPQALMASAKCFECGIYATAGQLMELSLLVLIAESS